MDKTEFIEFLSKAFENAIEAMNEGAAFYIWYADTSALEFHQACRNAKMTIRENPKYKKKEPPKDPLDKIIIGGMNPAYMVGKMEQHIIF